MQWHCDIFRSFRETAPESQLYITLAVKKQNFENTLCRHKLYSTEIIGDPFAATLDLRAFENDNCVVEFFFNFSCYRDAKNLSKAQSSEPSELEQRKGKRAKWNKNNERIRRENISLSNKIHKEAFRFSGYC